MASFLIDIDLDRVNTWELIEEIETRSLCLDNQEKRQLLDVVSYDDSEKWKLFLSIKDKYSLIELEDMFKEDLSTVIAKEQLTMNF